MVSLTLNTDSSDAEGYKTVNDNLMRNELKLFRKLTSEQQNKPVYAIYHNSVIDNIVAVKPRNMDDLSRIKGIGPVRLKDYGR